MKEAAIIGALVLVGACSDKLSDHLNRESMIRWFLRNLVPHSCFLAVVLLTIFFIGRFLVRMLS